MENELDPKKVKSEPHRRSTFGYLNSMTGSRSLRSALSREKMVESLKAMVWVVPLTLLIWIYAEREQIVYPNSPNANNIEVNISSSNPSRFVEPAGNPQPTVNLKLSGPQEAIEKVKEALTSTVPRGVSIDTGDMLRGENLPINIVDRIQNLQVFKSNGVTVLESQPSDVLINIDDKKSIDLPVEIAPADAANLTARFDPPTVTVYGPGQLLERHRTGQLHVYADLSLATLKNTGEQPVQVIPVRLSVPDDRISLKPLKVNATLVVKASDITADIDEIPIVVEASFETLRAYDISIEQADDHSTGTIALTGPPDLIKAIKDQTFKPMPKAVLEITKDDAIRLEPKSLRYDLPPGVHVSPAEADRKVVFKMTPRQSPGNPG